MNFSTNACKNHLLQKERPSNNLQQLYEYLKQFHLSDALYEIGLVQLSLARVKAYEHEIPERIRTWVNSSLNNDYLKLLYIPNF